MIETFSAVEFQKTSAHLNSQKYVCARILRGNTKNTCICLNDFYNIMYIKEAKLSEKFKRQDIITSHDIFKKLPLKW